MSGDMQFMLIGFVSGILGAFMGMIAMGDVMKDIAELKSQVDYLSLLVFDLTSASLRNSGSTSIRECQLDRDLGAHEKGQTQSAPIFS